MVSIVVPGEMKRPGQDRNQGKLGLYRKQMTGVVHDPKSHCPGTVLKSLTYIKIFNPHNCLMR